MTFEEFRATEAPISDGFWEILNAENPAPAPREAYRQFAEDFAMYEKNGKWWPHAWFYEPRGHETKESAVKDLFDWRAEFA